MKLRVFESDADGSSGKCFHQARTNFWFVVKKSLRREQGKWEANFVIKESKGDFREGFAIIFGKAASDQSMEEDRRAGSRECRETREDRSEQQG